jgi:acyl-CoA thioesterase
MTEQELAEAVVAKMYAQDGFSAWLGVQIESIKPGNVRCSMKIRKEMLNGFGKSHGGIAFSLADSAFAFAANTHGRVSVSIDNSISYPAPVQEGDTLTAEAREVSKSDKIGFYEVPVRNQHDVTVALFRGTVYRTPKVFFPEGT